MKRIKSNSGITLVALIVTIIVLIILAVISINAVFGEDGIVNRAEGASDRHKEGEQEDLNAIGYFDEVIANKIGEGEETPDPDTGGELTPGVLVTGQNADWTDGTSTYPAKIPAGFCVVKDVEKDGVKDTNTIANGLVISDVADDDLDNSKKGNQFVWIPVDDYSKFHLIEGYSNGNKQTFLTRATNPSREAGASKTEIKPNTSNTVLGTDESVAMYNSVETNHGFYIARFEAGISGTVDNYSFTTDDDDTTNLTVTTGAVKPLSQKGVGVWNSIPWGSSSSTTGTDNLPGSDTVDGAVKVARSMYPNTNKLSEYGLPTNLTNATGATSTLCYGVQWDAVMNFIDSNYYTGTCANDSFVKNSEGGNYSDKGKTISTTGYHQIKHIYDLGGNVYEWTMEAYSSRYRVNRGRLL